MPKDWRATVWLALRCISNCPPRYDWLSAVSPTAHHVMIGSPLYLRLPTTLWMDHRCISDCPPRYDWLTAVSPTAHHRMNGFTALSPTAHHVMIGSPLYLRLPTTVWMAHRCVSDCPPPYDWLAALSPTAHHVMIGSPLYLRLPTTLWLAHRSISDCPPPYDWLTVLSPTAPRRWWQLRCTAWWSWRPQSCRIQTRLQQT